MSPNTSQAVGCREVSDEVRLHKKRKTNQAASRSHFPWLHQFLTDGSLGAGIGYSLHWQSRNSHEHATGNDACHSVVVQDVQLPPIEK